MPSSKKTTQSAAPIDLSEEDCAVKLSALLKKAHGARTAALFRDDVISEHVTREAERAGLDRNMILGAYMGFVAHLLNPCEARYRQNKRLVHNIWVLHWILILGDSGVGKSKNRSIVIKANRILADFCSSKAEALDLPEHMVTRAREAADSFTADATAAGMLNKSESAKMKPPKLIAIADELSQVEARLAEGASSTKSGGGSNMSFMLSLSSVEFVGKDTGVESQSADALLATFIHFGQPLVYQSMVVKNAMRNEGLTNRYSPLFGVRVTATHDEQCDSDADDDDGAVVDGSVAEVLAAVGFRALLQMCVFPTLLAARSNVKTYYDKNPQSTPAPLDKNDKPSGPTQVATVIFEAVDGAGRDVLRTEYSECEALLADLEDTGKQGTPAHSCLMVYLCKRPESILRTCVPSEAIMAALEGFDVEGGYQGLNESFARNCVAEHSKLKREEIDTMYRVKPSGEVRRIISAEAAKHSVRFNTATADVQQACSASESNPLTQLESKLLDTESAMLQETDITQRVRLSRVVGWRAAARLEQLGLARILEFKRHARNQLLFLKRPITCDLTGAAPGKQEKLQTSALLASLTPTIEFQPYAQNLLATPTMPTGANLLEVIEPLIVLALKVDGVTMNEINDARTLHTTMPTKLTLPPTTDAQAAEVRQVHAFIWTLAGLTKDAPSRAAAAAALREMAAALVGDKPAGAGTKCGGPAETMGPPPPKKGPETAADPRVQPDTPRPEQPSPESRPPATSPGASGTQPATWVPFTMPNGTHVLINVTTNQVVPIPASVPSPSALTQAAYTTPAKASGGSGVDVLAAVRNGDGGESSDDGGEEDETDGEVDDNVDDDEVVITKDGPSQRPALATVSGNATSA